MSSFFSGKVVLVTGGCGSIGSELVRQLISLNVLKVRVFDHDENALFNMQRHLEQFKNVRFLLGDIRDKERIKLAMEGVDIVFHAAALKHVPSCEYNPFEAIKTNVLGTQNMIESALESRVGRVITISTDKAINPANVMGATKLLAERLTSSTFFYKGQKKTIFSSVRFGNVMNSRGSVIPVFREQIKGKEITVTEPDMTRFVMSIGQAVSLVLKASEIMQGGETFILKMPVLRLGDLADAMIEEIAPSYHINPSEVKVRIIGARAGEKMHECLMTEEEAKNALETDDMLILIPQIFIPNVTVKGFSYRRAKPTSMHSYSSGDARLLSKDEIKKIIASECKD
ncbi:MAG: polysaccharide biosynthesis protein [Candidatus Woesearchaeota archaeon]|nr:polysaccharide biosynthesis protein [Candidatus Woesearchaeota archaeon]